MYAIVTALQNGIPVSGKVPSKFATTKQAAVYTPSEMKGRCTPAAAGRCATTRPSAASRSPFDLATARSVNTAASLVLKLGTDKVQRTMSAMASASTGDPIQCYPAVVTLGANDTTPLTLASSYATLAAGGKYREPHPVDHHERRSRSSCRPPTASRSSARTAAGARAPRR